MFRSLLLIGSALTGLSSPIYSNVVEENGIKITYKYETNEVNSNDDLIVGNIYSFSVQSDEDLSDYGGTYFECEILSGTLTIIDVQYELESEYAPILLKSNYILNFNCTDGYVIYTIGSYTELNDNYQNFSYDLAYNLQSNDLVVKLTYFSGNSLDAVYRQFSSTTYNEIESVERVYPQNIFGNVSEFIDEYILSGIPLIDSVSNTINGTNITLRAWLNTSICIVLACLVIWLLIWFVRYLFRLFSGLLSH